MNPLRQVRVDGEYHSWGPEDIANALAPYGQISQFVPVIVKAGAEEVRVKPCEYHHPDRSRSSGWYFLCLVNLSGELFYRGSTTELSRAIRSLTGEGENIFPQPLTPWPPQ